MHLFLYVHKTKLYTLVTPHEIGYIIFGPPPPLLQQPRSTLHKTLSVDDKFLTGANFSIWYDNMISITIFYNHPIWVVA